MQSGGRILAVEAEGALIRSDLTLEALLRLVRRNPLYLALIPFWLMRGKDALQVELAARAELDPAALLYDEELLGRIRAARADGQRLALAAGMAPEFTAKIAAHVGPFDHVVHTEGAQRPHSLVEQLDDALGEGNWIHCSAPAETRPTSHSDKAWLTLKALRPHQWAKNLLVFAPLVLAHLVLDTEAILRSLLAFAAFCLAASSVYVVNDLVDLQEDRRHPEKKRRPFASGELSVRHGLLLAPALLAGAAGVSSLLPLEFGAVLAVYYVLSLAYSLRIKRMLLWDVILLAGLYTMRIVAGSAALELPRSVWLLAFSIFLFFSLANVKRYVELKRSGSSRGLVDRGRNYAAVDLETISQFGVASGLVSVLVLALYIDSATVKGLYGHPEVIWLICPILLYLVTRIWIMARRDELPDDPVVFLIKDGRSQISIAAGAMLVLLATL